MTTTTPPRIEAEQEHLFGAATDESVDVAAAEATEAAEAENEASAAAQPLVDVSRTAAAALLASAAGGILAAGLFPGWLPRIAAILAAAVGAGTVVLSYRSRRPATIQYLGIGAIVALGAVMAVSAGGEGSLPALVARAVTDGGIAQPPAPFSAGWRFLLVVIIGMLAFGAAIVGLATSRPKLAAFVPVPIAFGALLLQPDGANPATPLAALVLVGAGLAVAYGADLAREGAVSGTFELRRFLRAAGVMVVLLAALLAMTQLSFLFPTPDKNQVIPPKRPEPPPPAPDRVLFSVTSERIVPWRLGVLDVYDGEAWLTPPFDRTLLGKVPSSGLVPRSSKNVAGQPTGPVGSPEGSTPTEATIQVAGLTGRVLPSPANVTKVTTSGPSIEHDPRTQNLRLPEAEARSGLSYKVEAPTPAGAAELSKAPAPPASMSEFLEVPEAPPAITDLLAKAPQNNAFERLQFVRNSFYEKVVAAGAGDPVPVPPGRVVELLEGKDASPFEITAAEVLLARWTGVPARIGYGYYKGERVAPDKNEFTFRPRHGAMWLEAYFEGYGWVPLFGTPPRAKGSTNDANANKDPTVRPSEELALTVFVPIELSSLVQLFKVVQYWVLRVLPWVVAIALVVTLYPGVVKLLRARRRDRWARRLGLRARLAVAYASMRDVATDFNIGYAALTPLEFLAVIDDDLEHSELAWIVSRAMWADLARDLQSEDVEAAEAMARSLTLRIRRAQAPFNRVIAFTSRASLRDPYSDEIPNLWLEPRTLVRQSLADLLHPRRPGFRRSAAAWSGALVVGLAAAVVVAAVVTPERVVPSAASGRLPERMVPESTGNVRFQREPAPELAFAQAGPTSLVAEGAVFSLHQGREVQGSLQLGSFKPSLAGRERELRNRVLRGIGTGKSEIVSVGGERIHRIRQTEQKILIWLPRNSSYYVLMVARPAFAEAETVFGSVLAHQRGETVTDLRVATLPDPRRGIEPLP